MIELLECFWCSSEFYKWYCDNCTSEITDLCEHCHKEAEDKGF